ncbi:hypothetical protein FA95DRAFT_1609960 [Auriscalpium vulgare]|uniref:Uncharacterized protein n=1 Tax=Auriscalpium vulgare TaxID=40419 RepID=A0ACB8RGG1_9AGAM|nr:hypothetical protein FA95DRAFT_1609960 [Auriscalpium vulgare]
MSGRTGSHPAELRARLPHQPPLASNMPALPAHPGRVIAGGVAIVAATFVGLYAYMDWKHARKAARDPAHPGSLPVWEVRMKEHATPARGAAADVDIDITRRASAVAVRATPLDPPTRATDRAQHRTIAVVMKEHGAIPVDENGANMQPAPQRDRGDGLAYTKKTVTMKASAQKEA